MSTSYTNVFTGSPQLPAFPELLNLTLSANTQLSWPTAYQNTNLVVSGNMRVTPTNNGFTLTLPQVAIAASGQVPAQPFVGNGTSFTITNPSGFSFTLSTFTGNQTFVLAAGAAYQLLLFNNTTPDGSWQAIPAGGGSTSVTSVGAAIAGGALGNLTVTSSTTNPITGAGTFTFGVANDLLALIGFGASTGLSARTAANTWGLVSITGTANQIAVANGNGVGGNPTISLPATISGITSLTAGNIVISGNSIATNNTTQIILTPPVANQFIEVQGNIKLDTPYGIQWFAPDTVHYFQLTAQAMAGNVTLNLPATSPTLNQILQYQGGNNLGWASIPTFPGVSTPTAIAIYANSSGGLANSSVLIDASSNITGATSITVSNLTIGGLGTPNTISATNPNGNINLQPLGTGEVDSSGAIGILNQKPLKLYVGNAASNYVGLACSPSLTATINFTAPIADAITPFAPLVSNGSGALSFNNIAVVTTSVTFTAVQIDGMYATPLQVVAANANVIVVLYAYIYNNFNTTAFASGGPVVLQYGNTAHGAGTNTLSATIPASFINIVGPASSEYSLFGNPLTGAAGVTGLANSGLFLSNQTGAFTGGSVDTRVTVTVTYMVLPGA